jgi:serine/threonine-protein kinase RsbW
VLNASKELIIRNDLLELENLVEQVAAFCAQLRVTENILFDVRLALEEAISNTIRHGYMDRNPHDIRLSIELQNGELCLQIEDDGKAFNPLEAADPDLSLPIEEKQPGGLGIYLIKAVMDEVRYERRDGKNILRMKKLM